jgi:pimeloyl-ACP methyl ester carboxylesterase
MTLLLAQAGFRVLSGIAPSVAARAAASLFCTPRRHSRPDPERAVLAKAEPFALRMGLSSLAAWRWGTGPAVLLVHGWEGRGSQLYSFIDPLVARGYSVVTWDAPGHGDSAGKRSSLVEMSDALWAAGRQAGEVHGVIAHSLGSAAAAMAFAEGLPVGRAAFVSSPSSMAEYTFLFADLVGLSEPVRQRMVRSMERRFHVVFDELDVRRFQLPDAVPLLVVHDRDDLEVPLQHGRLLAKSWPGARLAITEGLGHRRLLKDPGVVSQVVDWIAAPG